MSKWAIWFSYSFHSKFVGPFLISYYFAFIPQYWVEIRNIQEHSELVMYTSSYILRNRKTYQWCQFSKFLIQTPLICRYNPDALLNDNQFPSHFYSLLIAGPNISSDWIDFSPSNFLFFTIFSASAFNSPSLFALANPTKSIFSGLRHFFSFLARA